LFHGARCVQVIPLGRDAPGGSVIALVQVDQPILPDLLKKIVGLEGVVQAKLLSF
jgi:D-3-phosphoglycerate dehydrogenase / 2-oxoglutarate reductase